ncbi:uncharacterized protein LOC123672268 isoform X2 [Harmonia axyridis]|uniref:uncharacterized protein LOC123672268 isoform X2 n=1 Tax=Harmonia axyridis TaxID=115357 RepID=UPI001E278F13|nr:uncharacterized protein LOC123672268 isoform X2 [Harmonia axyridis]
MYGRSETPGQWSVYAEFTISHPGSGDPDNVPRTRTEQNDNSVRMTYSWNSQNNHTTGAAWVPSETASTYSDNRPEASYGFQKGNLLFTSTPPPRRPSNLPAGSRLNPQESSGYGSNLLSPSSISSGQNTKCRSTCNITLGNQYPCHHHCGRTQSLRCQTPSSRSDLKNAYYGCGDPWCHHLRTGDDVSMGGRCSPVQEACEDCSSLNGRSTNKAATRSLSRELDGRKDVSVQTFEMVDKCTSPFLREDTGEKKRSRKVRRRSLSSQHRKTQESCSPSSFTPDSLESGRSQKSRSLVRSPKLSRIPHTKTDKSELSTTTGTGTDDKSSGSKKPRTVHIDVYCTGTEAESDSTNSDLSDNDTASTPQTVFESEQVKITHKRADVDEEPMTIRREGDNTSFRLKERPNEDKSDSDDGASMAYPSKLSSYSTIRDFASSISSVPRSWTNYSMSSCAIPDPDYDSVANTSWKDNTYSDIGSRSSIAGTESSLFVPRRLLNKDSSIDERPELVGKEGSKSPSLQLSDSFEYANSEDKMRIRRMEHVWQKDKVDKGSDERSESKRVQQAKRMNEYIQKKLRHLAKKESKETDSDESADSGDGWTFVKDNTGGSGTVKRTAKEATNDKNGPFERRSERNEESTQIEGTEEKTRFGRSG